MLKFDELGGNLPMAWLHEFFFEKWQIYGEGTLNTITVILPNNFELPLFRVFEL